MKYSLIIIWIFLLNVNLYSQQDSSKRLNSGLDSTINMRPKEDQRNYYLPLNKTEYKFQNQENRKLIFVKNKYYLVKLNDSGSMIMKAEVKITIDSVFILYGSPVDNDTTAAVNVLQSLGIKHNGKYMEYYTNGKIKVEGYYKNGVPIRRWKYYNINGALDFSTNHGNF